MIQREWQRVDPRYLDDEEQRFWGTIAGRQMRFDERQTFVQKLTEQGASKGALETFLSTCAAQNPNRRLRLIALADRVVLLDGGRVIADGTREGLLESSAEYREVLARAAVEQRAKVDDAPPDGVAETEPVTLP